MKSAIQIISLTTVLASLVTQILSDTLTDHDDVLIQNRIVLGGATGDGVGIVDHYAYSGHLFILELSNQNDLTIRAEVVVRIISPI